MFPPELLKSAENLLQQLRAGGLTLTTAESCTGGLVAALLTEIPGSSDVVYGGFITYANAAKSAMVGVPQALIEQHGAVSEPVARAMAEGALSAAHTDIAIAITGIAGPGGGSAEKPVGLVHLACARAGFATLHAREIFPGDRASVRRQSVEAALALVARMVGR